MGKQHPVPIREADFAAIEAAIMETRRGRRFLAEYARRNGNADTEQVLGVIDRLYNSLRSTAPEKRAIVDDMVASLIDMGDAIKRAKRGIFSLAGDGETDHPSDAGMELDAVVDATETATNRILSSAKRIQESAFAAMERGEASEEMAAIDAAVMEIHEGCSFQDITGQRIGKVINALRYIEERVTAMVKAWDQASGNGTASACARSGPGFADPPRDVADAIGPDAMAEEEPVTIWPETGSARGSVIEMPKTPARYPARIERGEEWRGQNVPAPSASTTAIGSQAALENMPTLTATEIDALYS